MFCNLTAGLIFTESEIHFLSFILIFLDIELESEMKEEKSKKQGGTIERTSRRRKSKTTSKPAVDGVC